MLARRFVFICVVTALFAMFLASLVVQPRETRQLFDLPLRPQSGV